MSPFQQIRGAQALLSPPDTWLPGYSFGAVDAAGWDCQRRAPEAVRFGVLAALVRLDGPVEARMIAAGYICKAVSAKWIGAWEHEPGRTQDDVLAALDAAADLAREGEWR